MTLPESGNFPSFLYMSLILSTICPITKSGFPTRPNPRKPHGNYFRDGPSVHPWKRKNRQAAYNRYLFILKNFPRIRFMTNGYLKNTRLRILYKHNIHIEILQPPFAFFLFFAGMRFPVGGRFSSESRFGKKSAKITKKKKTSSVYIDEARSNQDISQIIVREKKWNGKREKNQSKSLWRKS